MLVAVVVTGATTQWVGGICEASRVRKGEGGNGWGLECSVHSNYMSRLSVADLGGGGVVVESNHCDITQTQTQHKSGLDLCVCCFSGYNIVFVYFWAYNMVSRFVGMMVNDRNEHSS